MKKFLAWLLLAAALLGLCGCAPEANPPKTTEVETTAAEIQTAAAETEIPVSE